MKAMDSPVRQPLLNESIRIIVSVTEVDDAFFFAAELFEHCFKQRIPNFPRHYVAYYHETPHKSNVVGYVHYTQIEDLYLCGGLCIDERAYRRISSAHRSAIKAAGGIAEQLLRYTFQDLSSATGIFGYVGDVRSEKVCLRAGFTHTGLKHLLVHWPKVLEQDRKTALIRKIAEIGPF